MQLQTNRHFVLYLLQYGKFKVSYIFYTSILLFKEYLYKNYKLTLIVYNINIIHINLKIYIPRRRRRKLNVRNTFRRRPGRFVNVLCTFNLLPVSTGYLCFLKINDECRNYEAYIFPHFHIFPIDPRNQI